MNVLSTLPTTFLSLIFATGFIGLHAQETVIPFSELNGSGFSGNTSASCNGLQATNGPTGAFSGTFTDGTTTYNLSHQGTGPTDECDYAIFANDTLKTQDAVDGNWRLRIGNITQNRSHFRASVTFNSNIGGFEAGDFIRITVRESAFNGNILAGPVDIDFADIQTAQGSASGAGFTDTTWTSAPIQTANNTNNVYIEIQIHTGDAGGSTGQQEQIDISEIKITNCVDLTGLVVEIEDDVPSTPDADVCGSTMTVNLTGATELAGGEYNIRYNTTGTTAMTASNVAFDGAGDASFDLGVINGNGQTFRITRIDTVSGGNVCFTVPDPPIALLFNSADQPDVDNVGSSSSMVCPGETFQLTGTLSNGPATLEWSLVNPPTGVSANFVTGNGLSTDATLSSTSSSAETVTIQLKATNAAGCADSLSTTVTVNPTPDAPDISTVPSDTCQNYLTPLEVTSSSSSFTYNWTITSPTNVITTPTGASITFVFSEVGTYTVSVTATDVNTGCTSSSSTSVTIDATPEVDPPLVDLVPVCPGTNTQQVNLGSSPSGASFEWTIVVDPDHSGDANAPFGATAGSGQFIPSFVPTPQTPGAPNANDSVVITYTVVAVAANGCRSDLIATPVPETFDLSINPQPALLLVPADYPAICFGDSYFLPDLLSDVVDQNDPLTGDFSFHNMVPPAGEISLQNLNLTPSVTDPNLWVNKSTTNGGCIDSEQFTLFVLGPVDNNTVSVVNNSLANDICEAEPKLVLESDATNSGSGDLEYQWQVDRGNGTFVDLFDGDPINTDGGTFNLEMNGKQLEILLPPASADEYIFRVNVSISGSSVAANSLTECGPFTSSTQDIIIHPLPVVDALQVTKVSCNGGNNGAIAFTDIAGDQPITVTAVPQNTITSTPVIDVTGGDVSITNLEAEDYLVTITTVEGCSIDTLIEVPEADPLSFTLSKTDALCNGSEDGTITVNASGGCGTYEYSINNGAYQTGNEFTELIAGTYSIRIRDAMDITCITTTQQITVGEPDALEINATVNNVSCFGEADGEIGTNVMGGTMPYFYNWSGQDTIVPSTVVIAEYDFDTDISDWTPFLGSVNTFTNQMMASTGPLAAGPYWTYDPSAAPGESGDRSLGVLKTAAGQFVRWESPQFKNETIYPWENVTVNFDVEAPWFANDILLESNAVEFQWQVRLIGTNGNPGSWIPIFPTEVSIDNSGVTTGGTASPETWLSDATMDSEGKSARNLLLDLTPLGDIDPDMGVQVRFSYPTNNAPVTEDIMLGLDNFSIQANQLVDSLFGLVAGTYTLDLTDANGCNLVEEIEVIEPDSLGINVLSIPNPCEEDATFDIVYDGAVGTITGYQIFIDSSPVGNGQSSFVPWTTGSSGTLLVDQTIFEDFSNSPLTLTDGTYTIRLRLYGPNLNANPPNFCFADFGPFTLTIDDKPILDTSFDDDVCSDEELGYVAASIAGSPVDPTGLLLILEDVRVDAGLVAASTNVDTTSLPDTLSLDALSMDSYNSLASGGLFVEYDVRLITPDGCVGDLETLSFRVRSEPVLANDLDATVCSGRRTRITLAASTTSGNQGGQPNQYLFEITDIAPNGLTSNGNTLVGDVVGTNGIFNDRWTNNTGAPVDVVYTIVPFNNTANNQCQGDTAQITVTVETEPDLTIDLDYGQNSSLSDQRMNSTDGPVTVVYEICSGDDFFAAASMNAQSTFGTNFVQVTVAGANPEVLGYPNSQTFVTPVANFTFGAPDIINVDGVVKEAIINIRPYFEEVDDTQLDPSECRGGRIQITVRVNPEPAFSALTPIVRDTFCSEDMVDLVLIDPAQTAAGSTSPGITIYDQPGDFVFVVPPTVDESQDLDFTIWGADGGSFGTNQGGLGANVVFSIAGGTYNPLDTFLVGVGSAGVNGDGGDATVIVRNPFDGMIGTLEAIAAGGGGAGALLDGGNATLLGMSTDIMNGDTGVGFAGIGGQGFISLDPNVTTVLQGGMFRNTGGGGGAGLEGGDGGGSDIDAGGEGGTSWPTTPLNGNTNPNGPNGYVQIDYTLQVPDISFAVDTIINIDGLAEADLLGSPTAGDSTLLVGEQWTNLADTASTIQYTLFPQVTNTTCTGDDAAFDVILTIEPTPRIDLIGDVTTVSQFEEYTAEICGEGQLNIQLISPTVPSEGINRFRYRLEDIIIDNDGGNANITVDGSSTPSGSMTLGNGTQQIFLDDNIINTGTSAGSVTYTFFPFINRANGDPNCDGDTVTLIVNVDPTIVLPSISDPIADLCSEETLGSAFDFTDFSAFNVVPTSINLIGYSVSPNSGNFTASAGNVDTTGLGQNIPITGLNVDTLRNDVFTNLTGNGVTVSYTLTFNTSDGCESDPITYNFLVRAEPIIDTTIPRDTVCSGDQIGLVPMPTANSAFNLNFSGTQVVVDAIDLDGGTLATNNFAVGDTVLVGDLAGEVIDNDTGEPIVVSYTLTPISPNGCVGDQVTLEVVVEPAIIFDLELTIDGQPIILNNSISPISNPFEATVCANTPISAALDSISMPTPENPYLVRVRIQDPSLALGGPADQFINVPAANIGTLINAPAGIGSQITDPAEVTISILPYYDTNNDGNFDSGECDDPVTRFILTIEPGVDNWAAVRLDDVSSFTQDTLTICSETPFEVIMRQPPSSFPSMFSTNIEAFRVSVEIDPALTNISPTAVNEDLSDLVALNMDGDEVVIIADSIADNRIELDASFANSSPDTAFITYTITSLSAGGCEGMTETVTVAILGRSQAVPDPVDLCLGDDEFVLPNVVYNSGSIADYEWLYAGGTSRGVRLTNGSNSGGVLINDGVANQAAISPTFLFNGPTEDDLRIRTDLANSTSGTIDLILVVTTAECPNLGDTTRFTVTVAEPIEAGSAPSNPFEICEDDPIFDLFGGVVGAEPGGNWFLEDGPTDQGVFDPMAGTFDPVNITGTSVITYVFQYVTNEDSACPNDSLDNPLTILVTPTPRTGTPLPGNASVCQNGSIDLFTLLEPGSFDAGGSWSPAGFFDGTLVGSIYTPGINGGYNFEYTFPNLTDCAPVPSTVTVVVTNQAEAGVQNPNADTLICGIAMVELFDFIQNFQQGGTWTDEDNSGAVLNASTGTLDVSNVAPGSYTYRYTVTGDGSVCLGTDFVEVTLEILSSTDINIIGEDAPCVDEVEQYVLDIPIDPSATYDWSLQGGGGSIVGPDDSPVLVVQWGSTPVMNATVNVTYTSSDGCESTASLTVNTTTTTTAGFTFTSDNLTVDFTDASVGGVISYLWDFGDNTGTSSMENPSYTFATPGMYTVCLTVIGDCGTDTFCEDISVPEGTQFGVDTVILNPGFNLISFDVQPLDSSATAVFFDSLGANLLNVQGRDPVTGNPTLYVGPTFPFNSLTEIERGCGYYVRVLDADTIILSGELVDPAYKKDLLAGINLLGYIPQMPTTPSDYFSDLISNGNLLSAIGYDPNFQFFVDGFPFNSLTTIRNSRGYEIRVNNPVSGDNWLTNGDPATSAMRGLEDPVITNTYDFVAGYSNLSPDAEGDFVEIVDAEGTHLNWMRVLANGMLEATPVYGDDTMEDNLLGTPEGTALYLRYNGETVPAGVAFAGSKEIHIISVVFEGVLSSSSDDLSSSVSSFVAYPNPFYDNLDISIRLNQTTDVSLVVYDFLGRRVEDVLPLSRLSEGSHSFQWSPEGSLPNGNYRLVILGKSGILDQLSVVLQH